MLKLELNTESVGSMARKLVKQGVPDQPFEGWRGPMLCLVGKSLHEAARWMITESPSLCYKPFKACPPPSRKRSKATPATTLPETLDPSRNLSNGF